MRQSTKARFCVWALVPVCASVMAITADNPYQGIVDRNVFGLKAIPPPADPSEQNKPAPPKITPTGITTILGNKRALFKVSLPARPPEPAKEASYILAEGQRDGQIEVMEIDEKAGAIKFNNYGSVVTLTLEKDGAKVPNTPMPATPVAAAGVNPANYNPATYNPNAVPTAPGANPYAAPAGNPYAPGGSSVANFGGTANSGMQTLQSRTLRLPGASGGPSFGSVNQPQANPQMPNLTREEQLILMEVERERTRDRVNQGLMPPLPPTMMTPPGSPGGNPNPGGPPLPQ